MKKQKIISLVIMVVFLLSSINVVSAASAPRITLNDYQVTIKTKKNVKVVGTVSIAKGQNITVYKGNKKIASTKVKNTGGTADFSITIPKRSITKTGSNSFQVKSEKKKFGFITTLKESNSKPFTVIYNKTKKAKKTQTISCPSSTVYKGSTGSLGAKASSGLKLTYKSSNSKVVTVNKKGKITGKKPGSVKITIKQAGNKSYKPASKKVTVVCKLNRDDDMLSHAKAINGGAKYSVVTQFNYFGNHGLMKVYEKGTWKIKANSISTGSKKQRDGKNLGIFKLRGSPNTDYSNTSNKGPRLYDRDGSVKDSKGKAKYHEYFVTMYNKDSNAPAIHTYLYKPGTTSLYNGDEQYAKGNSLTFAKNPNLSNGCTRVNYDAAKFVYKYCPHGTPYEIYNYK